MPGESMGTDTDDVMHVDVLIVCWPCREFLSGDFVLILLSFLGLDGALRFAF